jgi:N-methylhydantoinase B
MGDHMPVHLGSMPMSVRAVIDRLELGLGDIAMVNDPFAGGTHLPDITLVAPVYVKRLSGKEKSSPRNRSHDSPDFFVAARAHHADIGGAFAGSMGLSREIYQEGLRIPPVLLVRSGETQRDVLQMVLSNVRTPTEREGDLGAEIAACNTGARRLEETCATYGLARVHRATDELQQYAEAMTRKLLASIPPGEYSAEDFLDNDGISDQPVRVALIVRVAQPKPRSNRPLVTIDFTGSAPQVEGSVNAVEAITYSACFYVFRCLLAENMPAAAGIMRPIRVIAPEGTVVNARPPAAVAGGNVEMSQRIVDTLLRALSQALPERIPAASSGTMNNLTIGGLLPSGHARAGEPFAYYETIAGGMGARPGQDGISGVHTHMTNSLNTPAEALEYAYPFRVTRYSLRPGSGGEGIHRGGDGIIREIELLCDAEVTLLADRRMRGPYGLHGGSDGTPGRNIVLLRDGSEMPIPAKGSVRLSRGDRVRIESPGGGGWGMRNL